MKGTSVLFETSLAWLQQSGNAAAIKGGLRGLEKESLRVQPTGQLAMSKHPDSLGSALTHPYLTTDYSEALLEFVTPPKTANWQALQFLCDSHAFVHRGLGKEMLWPASMPCVVNANEEIPIADYGSSNAGMMRTIYRRGLGFRYGRAMQAIAGAHFNYSPPEAFWPAYHDACGGGLDLKEFRSRQSMGLVRNYRRHAWLVIYLFGASPAFCKSFRPEGHALLSEFDSSTWYAPFATSLRMSDIGYRNKTQARLNISANSLHEYVQGLGAAITTVEPDYEAIGVVVDGEYRQLNANILQIENEYYSSIRPKPKRRDIRPTAALGRDGIEYVEIRSLDLSAEDPVGVNQVQLRFLEALTLFCLLDDSPPITPAEQTEINARDLNVARAGRTPGLTFSVGGVEVGLRDHAHALLERIAAIAELLDHDEEGYVAAVEQCRATIADPHATPSARLLQALKDTGASFFEYGLSLARDHRDYFLSLPMDEAQLASMQAQAVQSLADARAAEARAEPSFERYLQNYFEA
jgi:glutamate--cysteine ligase